MDSESEELAPNNAELAKIGEDIQKLLKQQQEAEELSGQPEQQQPVQQPVKTPIADQQKRGQFEVRCEGNADNNSNV